MKEVRMRRLLTILGLGFLMVTLLLTGCAQGGEIKVASKIDTEGSLLSQMIILMLRAEGFDVVDMSQLGPTQVVRKALLSGEIDIYPEYTGNGAFFFEGTDSELWKNPQSGYQKVKELDMAENNVVWLAPAPANNTWAIAIPRDLSEKENLKSLADFAAYANKGGYVKLIGSTEFVTSAVALPSFFEVYGFELKQEQLVTLSGGNTAVTEKAAAEGTDGVNAAMAYGTDGSLSALNLVVLSDPKNAQPVYEPAPIVRGEIAEKYPKLGEILNPVFVSLDLETLQSLNAKIALGEQNAVDVAHGYLTEKGFLK